MKMSDNPIVVDIGSVGEEMWFEHEYCGALLMTEFVCAPLADIRIEVI
jgi:hypothetical protein